jgi:hypothetical protein
MQRRSPGQAENTANHKTDPEVGVQCSHLGIASERYTKGLAAALEIFGGYNEWTGCIPEAMSGRALPLSAPRPLDGWEGLN